MTTLTLTGTLLLTIVDNQPKWMTIQQLEDILGQDPILILGECQRQETDMAVLFSNALGDYGKVEVHRDHCGTYHLEEMSGFDLEQLIIDWDNEHGAQLYGHVVKYPANATPHPRWPC